jgi:polygalacturonase
VLVEDCTFGESHGVLTLGSESIHARNIVLRNCTVESNTPLLRLKMRPDTYQIFENITIDNVTGKCGSIIDMNPWTQFYTMEGSNEKPYGIVRNISISNINMKCNRFGIMKGNPADTVSNVLFKNINVNATATGFKTSYKDIKTENVTVNGSPLVLE